MTAYSRPSRRTLLQAIGLILGGTAGLGLPRGAVAVPTLGEARPFDPDLVEQLARELASKPFEEPKQVPEPWRDMKYDEYRDIRFRPDRALWQDRDFDYELQLFPPGFYFKSGVEIDLVEDGMARHVGFNADLFDFGPLVPDLPVEEDLGFSGFRVHAPINKPDYKDEFIVFQGASYFRGVARDQGYGLSARGLALRTADPRGEEFPVFRRFWVEAPGDDRPDIIVHALLDSESVTGAYHYSIAPGAETVMDCRSVIFPRVDLDHVGIGPMTSMFLFDEKHAKRFDDYRPAVHDSNGLAVVNGNGERLWRPLANPKTLQVSNFLDNNPRGFGLIQRGRDFDDYNDLEARYDKRPSLWIEPRGDWGKGSVSLVEIPADEEIYDNIVAFWRPSEVLPAGSEHEFSYRLVWCWDAPGEGEVAPVTRTSFGRRLTYGSDAKEGELVVIDFGELAGGPVPVEELTADVHVIGGELLNKLVQENTVTGGMRVAFSFDRSDQETIELRAQLRHKGTAVSEVWLHRWLAG